jgi:hypothetical protein
MTTILDLNGKRGLIVGVANEHSIAYTLAQKPLSDESLRRMAFSRWENEGGATASGRVKYPEKAEATIPSWVAISYTLMVCVIVPVYWREYGLANFLWFSDIALLLMVSALWLKSPLLSSMMAVGVLPLEIIWMVAFFSGGTLGHMADYMFDPNLSVFLRGLSLFHFPMPAAIIFMLIRFGYDKRALFAQTILALIILPLTYALSTPKDNINWVYGLDTIQTSLPPLLYLALLALTMICLVFVPMHVLLKKLFPLP